jgi:hypothetical protein
VESPQFMNVRPDGSMAAENLFHRINLLSFPRLRAGGWFYPP